MIIKWLGPMGTWLFEAFSVLFLKKVLDLGRRDARSNREDMDLHITYLPKKGKKWSLKKKD